MDLPGQDIQIGDVTVVVPTFNERGNVPKLVHALFRLYPGIHVLIVDDHSPDGTADVVRELQASYPDLMLLERLQNPGFGRSYRDGFRHALSYPQCKAIVMMDADYSHDPKEIGGMVEGLARYDVMVGSRYVRGGNVRNWVWHRRMLSIGANIYVKLVLGLPVRDATAGFVCMRRTALEAIPFRTTVSEGYSFQVEQKYLFRRSRQRMGEHPITFAERQVGVSKMSAGKIAESFMMPWRIRLGKKVSASIRTADEISG